MKTVLAYVVCAVVWGTTWFAIRVCIADGGYPTVPAAALRFTVAAAVMVPLVVFGMARPGPTRPRQWGWLAVAGLLNAIGYSLVYLGEESVSGGLAAVLFGIEPLAVALLVTLTRTESVQRSDLVGALISLAGVGIIFWDRLDVSSEQAVGVGLILGAVFVSGLYALILKRETAELHPLASAAVFLSVTTAALWLLVLVRGWEPLPWPPPLASTLALVYLAVFGSVIAFATYFYLLKKLSLMAVTTLVFVLPVVALAVDAVWEDDVVLVGRTYVGVAVTLGGVLVSLLLKRAPAAATLPTPEV